MKAHRATILATGALTLVIAGTPAVAQINDEIVLNIMRECARIDDPTARLACYDNNIRAAGANPRTSVPGRMQTPQSSSGAPITQSSPQGFGAETVRSPQRFEARNSEEVDEISATITAISERAPGSYMFTIDGGARWQFTDSVGMNYRVPRVGSTVEIERGALGGFLMRFDRQQAVAVRRIQ